jgi:hypothetical protein
MKPSLPAATVALLTCLLAACNQPFQPVSPVSNNLVLYSILNSQSDTQYVRLSTTYESSGAADVKDAIVKLAGGGSTILFRDTTVEWIDTQGSISQTNVYVAYNVAVKDGVQYQLSATTPSGLSATANTTSLVLPTFDLYIGTPGKFTFYTQFKSISGAYVARFYIEFNVFVAGNPELHREEVPASSYVTNAGDTVYIYPEFSRVQWVAQSPELYPIQFDSLLFDQARRWIYQRYAQTQFAFKDILFTLTQIDDPLYSYFYVHNGPPDKTTIRLDVADFTNVKNGYGVFGCRVQVTLEYPLIR